MTERVRGIASRREGRSPTASRPAAWPAPFAPEPFAEPVAPAVGERAAGPYPGIERSPTQAE
jgi:hypothetical protein